VPMVTAFGEAGGKQMIPKQNFVAREMIGAVRGPRD
jgi:hypothetical protein